MDIKTALGRAIQHLSLSTDEMADVMRDIMTGQCTDAQIGAFLVALRMKSETIDEIEGAARVMRDLVTPVDIADLKHVVDIVGTGGDGANLFNVSSASTFVAAAAGAVVAKHGNRSVSSKSGSADLLESAGINLALSAAQVEQCIREVGVGFMFAVNHHSAMKHAIGPRKEIAQRTIFNILGPLTNPAGVKRLLLGVFSAELCRPLAEVLKRLGAEHVMVVHALDGLDEISLASATEVAELKNGEISEYRITPEDCGLKSQSLVGLDVADSTASLQLIRDAFSNQDSETARKAADMVALNAGAALYVAGKADSLSDGVALAQQTLTSGAALQKMQQLADFSQGLS
ncbi:anthranilate phosphoribosyltransferase [Litorivivens lipolytica]|uniref:Anthranilate phosphoribosyltransferase n=1 Tax=Litorivivens lipolytica TaxID=1524264 RepID=A0A7W4Z7L0_9GAMM|nr:anthranilate phosphoribosyltransferase [Litorivivens lipolytica]MBB3048140.1 anthranilate phosphoribosyltransferase [Litorivivens lipolytica]